MTMKALQIAAPETVTVVDIPEPEIKAAGQLLVRMQAVGIIPHHERRIFRNQYRAGKAATYPCPPGFPRRAGEGRVQKASPAAAGFQPGDRVVLSGYASDLYQELIVCPAKWAAPVSGDRSPEALVATEVFARALALIKRSQKIFRAHCVIIGAGPMGLSAILWLRTLGSWTLTAVEANAVRRLMAQEFGADTVIAPDDARSLATLADSRPDTVIECSGTSSGITAVFSLAGKEALVLGFIDKPLEVDPSRWMEKNLTIRAQHGYDEAIWEETTACLDRKLIDPGRLVTRTLPFSAESYRQVMEDSDRPEMLISVMEFAA